jgi:hypothetical protein
MLLGPIASQLRGKRLLIVADGALQYIPFGALPVPERQGDGATGRWGDGEGFLPVEGRVTERRIDGASSKSSCAAALLTRKSWLAKLSIETRTAILSPGARRLRLELGTEGFTRYHAEVLTAEGDLVWSRDALRERSTRIGKAVVITLPVALLTKNSYLITLSGIATGDNYARIDSYYFDLIRK